MVESFLDMLAKRRIPQALIESNRAALAGWAIFRAHNPDVNSTEKPMEFAFLNAIRRSPSFPAFPL